MSSFDPQSEWQPAASADKFEELRRLLLGDEQSLISTLEHRLNDVENAQQIIDALRTELHNVRDEKISRDDFERRLNALGLDIGELSELLPQAIRRAAKSNEDLSVALGPTLADAFQDSVRKNPQALADAVSPIMGPAIRRSISQAINSMIQSLSRTLDHTVSAKGLRWRWEALTTGRPFAEVVLLHSMRFMVEHVFLIRKEDGIVLQHVTSLPSKATDADLVSGMLTALQDFVRDSLGGKDSDHLEDLRVGDREIWIEHGTQAILAAVIRGHAAPDLRSTLQEVSERIHLDYQQAFQQFDGQTDVFSSTEDDLRECLAFAYRDEEKQSTKIWPVAIGLTLATILLIGLLVGWGMRWRHESVVQRIAIHLAPPDSVELELQRGVLTVRGEAPQDWIQRLESIAPAFPEVRQLDIGQLANQDDQWLAYLAKLRALPGIVVTRAERIEDQRYALELLRDPLAADPSELMAEFGLTTNEVIATVRRFQSDEGSFPLQRAQQLLGTEPSIRWDVQGRVLTATGSASRAWLNRARQFAQQQTGFEVVVQDVIDADMVALEQAREAVEKFIVRHKDGTAQLTDASESTLDECAREISALIESANAIDETIHVVVVGYADPEESQDSPPQTLSDQRARLVWRQLIQRAVPERHLMIRALGTGPVASPDGQPIGDRRYCEFDVRLGSD